MSVDPLADKYPAYSPYNYVLGNPLRLVGPGARAPTDWYRDGTVQFSALMHSQFDWYTDRLSATNCAALEHAYEVSASLSCADCNGVALELLPVARRLAWLLMRERDRLDSQEQAVLNAIENDTDQR